MRTVKVEIPIGSPDDMETLTEAVLARHTALGAGSPLTGEVDMALLATKHGITVAKRAQSHLEQGNSEADMLMANTAMGTAPGQNIDTPDTVYHLTALVRDRLSFVHDGFEEELEKYGFNVVISNVGGNKSVSIEIPITNSQRMEKLVKNILDRHNALGASSPLLNQVNVALLATQITTAKDKRKNARLLHGNSQALMQQADTALGTEQGQTIKTKGTVYYLLARVRDRLLFVHKGEEEQLSTYGFNVVISEGAEESTPPEGTFTAEPASIAAGQSSTLTHNITGSVSQSIDNGIGEVPAAGTTQVNPAQTTTYTLKAVAPDESTLTISAPVTVVPV